MDWRDFVWCIKGWFDELIAPNFFAGIDGLYNISSFLENLIRPSHKGKE